LCVCLGVSVFHSVCVVVTSTEQLVRLQRRIKDFMLNKNKDLHLAKHRTKQNFYRHQSSMRKDEAEDLDDNAGIAYVVYACVCWGGGIVKRVAAHQCFVVVPFCPLLASRCDKLLEAG
jgi:hypothetical protein